MALNPIPNARSGDPYSWFWSYSEGGVNYICATQGGAWVLRLRAVLNLTPSDVWDDALQAALIAQAQGLGPAWAPIVALLTNDLTNRTVSPQSVKFGLYLAYYRHAGKRADTIGISPNAVLPAWGVSPAPFDPAGWGAHNQEEIVCFVPGVDPPPPLSMAETVVAVRDSQDGVRAGRGTPGGTGLIHGPGAGVNGWLLFALGLLFVGGVWVIARKT